MYQNLIKTIKLIGLKSFFQYFFFQKILRINGKVPWPVHWSSIVTHHDKISVDYWRPFPGYMPGQYFQGINGIKIGKNVRLGPGVKVVSASHNIYDYDLHDKVPPIEIGNHCWLAANAIVLPGVKLGDHTIVAAGAVVSSSFPNGNCIIGGVPAKVVKKIEEYKGEITY